MPIGYAPGPFAVDWEERFDFAGLRRTRVAKARRAVHPPGRGALRLWKDGNIRYLTSLRAQLIAGKSTSLNGVLLTRDQEPILICSGGERDMALHGMRWLTRVHAIPVMEQRDLVDGFVREIL